jgi:hypothetical protein
MYVAIFPIIFAVLISKLYSGLDPTRIKRILTAALVLHIVFTVSELTVTSNKVFQKIWRGWENPRSQTMNKVFEQEVDIKNPTLFFHYGYSGDSKLANFWLTAFTEPADPIKGWNYTIDTSGDVKQICDVNAYYPRVTVVTSDSKLEELLLQTCPNEEFVIKLEAPAI